jgi:hypothetical protein
MTRHDYILLSGALATAARACETEPGGFLTVVGITLAAEAIAGALARDNPRFDRERFLRDAGVQP